MYKKILAPLDGSKFSECSLSHVGAIVAGCQVPEVVLLRVIEPLLQVYEMDEDWPRNMEKQAQANAEDYLSKLAKRLKKEGVAAETVIAHGKADEKILDYAKNNQVDLIIMSTHGRSGVSRWVLGSVADRVIQHSTVPVLMISPAGCRI